MTDGSRIGHLAPSTRLSDNGVIRNNRVDLLQLPPQGMERC